MLVGSDVFTIHAERGIAISRFEIAEDLIVGAIFFDDVNHVANGILPARKLKLAGICAQEIVFFDLFCVGCQILLDIGEAEPRN